MSSAELVILITGRQTDRRMYIHTYIHTTDLIVQPTPVSETVRQQPAVCNTYRSTIRIVVVDAALLSAENVHVRLSDNFYLP